jgi:hypothetical protein
MSPRSTAAGRLGQIVEVIRQHGVGGDEPEDGIVLELR